MICSNNRCFAHTVGKDGVGLCPQCLEKAGDDNYQVCICDYCKHIYSVRPKLRKDEPKTVEGVCGFCAKEVKRREKE